MENYVEGKKLSSNESDAHVTCRGAVAERAPQYGGETIELAFFELNRKTLFSEQLIKPLII